MNILVLLMVCFSLVDMKFVTSKRNDDYSFQDYQHVKLNNKLTYQVATPLQVKTQDTQHTLPSLQQKCLSLYKNDIDLLRKSALKLFFTCSISQIFKDIWILIIYTSEFAATSITDMAIIIGDFIVCSTSSNPITLAYCIYKAIRNLPEEVKDLWAITVEFIEKIKELFPTIVQHYKSCFNNSYNVYYEKLQKFCGIVALEPNMLLV